MSNKFENQKETRLFLYPIIVSIGIIPLIVRYREFESRLGEAPWYTQSLFNDLFDRTKAQMFILIVILMIIILLFSVFRKKKVKKSFRIFLPLGIYSFFAILSSITSEYSYFSFHGILEHFESIWVLLGYCILTLYSYWFIRESEDIEMVVKGLFIGCGILCLIGVGQGFSLDFYRTSLAEKLILPSFMWNMDAINFEFELGRVYTSLYNPNYIGSYVSLLVPVVLAALLGRKKNRIACIVLLVSLLFCLWGSKSLTGMISLVVEIIVFIFFLRKRILAVIKKIPVPIVLIISLVVLAIAVWGGNRLIQKVTAKTGIEQRTSLLSDIETNDDNVTIIYNGKKLIIQCEVTEDNSIQFMYYDDNGNTLPYYLSEDYSYYYIDAEPFREIPIQPLYYSDYDMVAFAVFIEGKEWEFTNQKGDGSYYFINAMGKFDKIQHPEKAFPDNMQSLASGRVGIWSKTIPLLKKYIFLGSGADTFLLIYPNSSYVDDYLAGGDGKTVVSKPHNMYLQMAVQTGVISLIAFLMFYGIYFVNSIKIYWNGKLDSYEWWIGMGIFCGTVGYMVSGLANDSTICVAPVFWGLLGIGMAVNYFLKRKQAA